MIGKLEQTFIDDCPYGPDGLLLDEILESKKAAGAAGKGNQP